MNPYHLTLAVAWLCFTGRPEAVFVEPVGERVVLVEIESRVHLDQQRNTRVRIETWEFSE